MMSILLQVLFSISIALIVLHVVVWVLTKMQSRFLSTTFAIRGIYASVSASAFMLSFHEIGRIVAYH